MRRAREARPASGAYSAAIAISRKATKIAAVPNVISDADRGRLEPEQQAGPGDDGRRDDAAERRLAAVDAAQEASSRAARRRAPSSRSRATVPPCAAIPQARNASSTTSANGLLDQPPNEATTAVETGSMSWPATTAAGSGCASVVAKALRITSAPTLSSAIQTARGTCLRGALGLLGGGDGRVEADERPAADGERREQRGERAAARQRLGAERVGEHAEALLAEDEQQREADADATRSPRRRRRAAARPSARRRRSR